MSPEAIKHSIVKHRILVLCVIGVLMLLVIVDEVATFQEIKDGTPEIEKTQG